MADRPPLQPRRPWNPTTDRPLEPRVEVYRATGAWGRVVEVTRDLDTNERTYRELRPATPPSDQSANEPGTRGLKGAYAAFSFLPQA